jgi:hypothetical protein
MNLDGCSESVKKEIIAMHDQYLENGDRVKELRLEKKKSYIMRYLFFKLKVLYKKYNG